MGRTQTLHQPEALFNLPPSAKSAFSPPPCLLGFTGLQCNSYTCSPPPFGFTGHWKGWVVITQTHIWCNGGGVAAQWV